MKGTVSIFCVFALACCARASWYWPFGSDDGGDAEQPRVSELMAPATRLIDEAADLAAEGRTDESVEKYRRALTELDRIELENPDRAKLPEFATLRNKRAYVNAAIDSMLLGQVKANARAVAVSDTTELERRLAAEKSGASKEAAKDAAKDAVPAPAAPAAKPEKPAAKPGKPVKPLTKLEQAVADIAGGDYAAAEILIREMMLSQPNDAAALNLKASMEARQGKFKEAEETLDRAIMSNPRSYYAYYNMARLMMQTNPANKKPAKRYYETGRAVGGPEDENLEALFR